MEVGQAAGAVCLYGSIARDDSDSASDVDVLVVGDVDDNEVAAALARHARAGREVSNGRELSPMRFAWREIDHMAGYGSLFLHHIRLEGEILSDPSGRLARHLDCLPPYQRVSQELDSFEAVLSDVAVAVARDHSPAFELAVIATALRHAFILGCYARGVPTFGRTSPFRILGRELHMSEDQVADLESLYDFRLYQAGRKPRPFDASTLDVASWLDIASNLLMTIRGELRDLNCAVS